MSDDYVDESEKSPSPLKDKTNFGSKVLNPININDSFSSVGDQNEDSKTPSNTANMKYSYVMNNLF